MLSLALLGGEDDRILPTEDSEESSLILGLLENLHLLELVAGGYVATDFLRGQPWAGELRDRPLED